MRIFEIVTEAEGDFAKYRQLGKDPLKLVGHLAKEVPASAVSAVVKTGKLGANLTGMDDDEPEEKKSSKTSSKSVSVDTQKTADTSTVNVEKTKSILDKLIKGESASQDDLQHVMKLSNQVDDPQLQMTLDKIQRGSALEFTDQRQLKIYRNSL
jgi:hypothetical protein